MRDAPAQRSARPRGLDQEVKGVNSRVRKPVSQGARATALGWAPDPTSRQEG